MNLEIFYDSKILRVKGLSLSLSLSLKLFELLKNISYKSFTTRIFIYNHVNRIFSKIFEKFILYSSIIYLFFLLHVCKVLS